MLEPGELLTRVMLRVKRVPAPESGVKSFEKPETRNVLIGPPPGRMLAITFQLLLVRPVPLIGELWKVMIVESKVKSPWNPTRLSDALSDVVTTGCVKSVVAILTVATGNETVPAIGDGVGMGDGVGVGVGVRVGVGVGVGEGVGVADGVGVGALGP